MQTPLYHIDAFTEVPFRGNPAAVCLFPDDVSPDDATLQAIAREMNLSETAFVWRHPKERARFALRWFAPRMEIALCGHATLASFHALLEHGWLEASERAIFDTKSGALRAGPLPEGRIELDFPAIRTEPCEPPVGLFAALGVIEGEVRRGPTDYLICVDHEETVRALAPDFERLRQVDMRGVMITARTNRDGADFVSRFFCPRVGVDEDPVTGSAHCALGVYWANAIGRTRLLGYQASARTGFVETELDGDRMFLRGSAVTVLHGTLRLPS